MILGACRYQYSTRGVLIPEEVAKLGIEMKKPGEVTLESEYEKIKNVRNALRARHFIGLIILIENNAINACNLNG